MNSIDYENSIQGRFLFLLLSFTVVFDAINGAITMYRPGVLELVIPFLRVLFIIFYYKVLLDINSKKAISVIIVSIFFIVTILITSFVSSYQTFSYVFEDLMYGIKIINFYILSSLMVELSSKVSFRWFNKILLSNLYYICLLIIIPTQLNLSRQTYINSGLGSMGFYIANNSTNITLIMLIFVLVYNLWYVKNLKIVNIIFFVLSLISLWLQSTKTSIFILFIIFLLNMFFYFKLKLLKKNLKIKEILIFFLLIIGGIFFLLVFGQKINLLKEYLFQDFLIRQQYQLKNFSGNKILYLTSGRLLFLKNIYFELKQTNNVYNWFFGVGASFLKHIYGKITEMDLFDIYFSTGILGVFLTYVTTIKYMLKLSLINFYQKYILFLIIVVLLYSLFAGHLYVDIISTTIFSIIIALGNAKQGSEKIYD